MLVGQQLLRAQPRDVTDGVARDSARMACYAQGGPLPARQSSDSLTPAKAEPPIRLPRPSDLDVQPLESTHVLRRLPINRDCCLSKPSRCHLTPTCRVRGLADKRPSEGVEMGDGRHSPRLQHDGGRHPDAVLAVCDQRRQQAHC